MSEKTPCPYCENFEATCFMVQGKVQAFQFCPICGKSYLRSVAELQEAETKTEDV